MLELNQTAGVLKTANVDAAKLSAKLVAGKIINQRASKLIRPQLPMMVRGYADSPIGEAVLANIIAGAIVHFAPSNPKAVLVSEAMIQAASLEFLNSFNLDEKINELLDGIDMKTLTAEEA